MKVIFFENKEGKELYRKTTPIDLDRSRIAKNDATYPGSFKRSPSARFEKIICQPKSKQRENGQNWSGWLTVSRLCSNYIKNSKCQHMAFVEEKWKNTYIGIVEFFCFLLFLLLLLSLWRFWLFYCKNRLFQPWISRVIQVWGWLFLGQVILLIHMAMLAGHFKEASPKFWYDCVVWKYSSGVFSPRLKLAPKYIWHLYNKGSLLGPVFGT